MPATPLRCHTLHKDATLFLLLLLMLLLPCLLRRRHVIRHIAAFAMRAFDVDYITPHHAILYAPCRQLPCHYCHASDYADAACH